MFYLTRPLAQWRVPCSEAYCALPIALNNEHTFYTEDALTMILADNEVHIEVCRSFRDENYTFDYTLPIPRGQ